MNGLRIVGFGGTPGGDSASERLVREVLAACERRGATTQLFGGTTLATFPHYDLANPSRTAEQRAFLEAIHSASGLIVGTPSYHGGASGLIKNALDLLQDLADAPTAGLDQRPVGLAVSAKGRQALGATLSSLSHMIHALGGWTAPSGVAVDILASPGFDPISDVLDPAVATAVDLQASQVMAAALSRQARLAALPDSDQFWPDYPIEPWILTRWHVGELQLER